MPPRAGLSEDVILGAAAAIADRDGVEAVTLAAVAAELGVQAPSLYNHIDGLEGLRRGLAAIGTEQLAVRLTRAAVGRSGEEAVYAVADAYRAYAKQRPGLYAAIVRAPGPGDDRTTQAAQRILEVVGAALSPYRLGRDDLIHAIRGLRSLVHGFVSLEMGGGFGMRQDVEQSFRHAVRTYLRGLGRRRDRRSRDPRS